MNILFCTHRVGLNVIFFLLQFFALNWLYATELNINIENVKVVEQANSTVIEFNIPAFSFDKYRNFKFQLANEHYYRQQNIPLPTGVLQTFSNLNNGVLSVALQFRPAINFSQGLQLLVDFRWLGGKTIRKIEVPDSNHLPSSNTITISLPEFILVEPGDTAGQLLSGMYSDTGLIDRALIALQKLNPTAFINNNVNRIKAGSKIQIPTVDEMNIIGVQEAKLNIQQQHKDYETFKSQILNKLPTLDSVPQSVQGEATIIKEAPQSNVVQNELKLSHDANKIDQIAKNKENQEAETRLAELQKNLNDLTKLNTEIGTISNTTIPTNRDDTQDVFQKWMNFFPQITWILWLVLIVAFSGVLWLIFYFRSKQINKALNNQIDEVFFTDTTHIVQISENAVRSNEALPEKASNATIPDLFSKISLSDMPVISPLEVRFNLAKLLWENGFHHFAITLTHEVCHLTHDKSLKIVATDWLTSIQNNTK